MTVVAIQRHANTSVTTYTVDFSLTESRRPLRLYCESGTPAYTGIVRRTASFQTLDDKAVALASSIFAINGIPGGHRLVGGNTITIERHLVRVQRDTALTTDEEVEAQVVAILERAAGVPAGSAEIVIDEHQRTPEFAEAKRQADEEIEALGGLDYDSLAEDSYYY